MHQRGHLRQKLILLSVGILAVYYVLVYLFSALFMEPYYLHNVENRLVSAYQTLSGLDEVDLAVISQLEEQNITIVVADADDDSILYNSQLADRFMPDMVGRILPFIRDHASASDSGYFINTDEMFQHTSSGVMVSGGKRVMLGGVSGNYLFDLSTSYASISQATEISMQFTLIVGLLVMVLAFVAFSRMASTVTEPVMQITDIAKKIAHLDFSQQCDTGAGGEIGEMAESINTMSNLMQTHIQKLETANAQLLEDIKAKKEQEEARKNLVANLSHDLKTPIGLISGYADGLRSGMAKTDAEVKEYCDVICDESDRMMSMILKMMELFRLESGTVTLEEEEFDLSELIAYVLDIFSIEIERANLDFTSHLPDDMYIRSDYFSVEQVITNYMQNAISHMGNGKVLRICAEDRGDFYRVRIFNSADPIPETEMDAIWDSFYRLDKSRTRDRRESGLGLSIVRSNMELLGGHYGVKNVSGGVEFWAEFRKSE